MKTNRIIRGISLFMSCIMVACCFMTAVSATVQTVNETYTDFSSNSFLKFNNDIPDYAITTVDGESVFDLNEVTYDNHDYSTGHNKLLQYAYTGINKGTRPTKVSFKLFVNKYANNGLFFFPLSRFDLVDKRSNFAPYITIACDKNAINLSVSSDQTLNYYKDSSFDAQYFGSIFNIKSTAVPDMLDKWINIVCDYDWSEYNEENGFKITIKFRIVDKNGFSIYKTEFVTSKLVDIPTIEDFTIAFTEHQSTDHSQKVLIDDLYVWSEYVDGTRTFAPENIPDYLKDQNSADNKTYSNFSYEVPFSFAGDVPNYAIKVFEDRKVFDLNDVTYNDMDSTSHNKKLQYCYTGLTEDSRPTKVELKYYFKADPSKGNGFFFFPFSGFSLVGGGSNYSPYIGISGDLSGNSVLASDSTWNTAGLGKYFEVQKFNFATNSVKAGSGSWLTLRCEYDWSKYNSENNYLISVSVKTLKEDGSILNDISFTIKKSESSQLVDGFTFAITERQGTTHDTPIYFKDLQVWSEKSDGSKTFTPPSRSQQFIETFQALLNKTVDQITLDDEIDVLNAVKCYNELPGNITDSLSEQKNKLDEFNNKILGLSEAKQEAQAEQFRSDYSRVLSLDIKTVDVSDENDIKAAIEIYNSLYSKTQELLSEEKELLDSLLIKISEIKIQVEYGFSTPTLGQGFNSDFEAENSDKAWTKDSLQLYAAPHSQTKPLSEDGKGLEIDRVVDPKDPQNHVLRVKGSWGLAVPYSFAIPEQSAMTKASFRVTTLDNSGGWNNAFRMIPAYLDENNYTYIEFTNSDDGWTTRGGTYINGVLSGSNSVKQTLSKSSDLLEGFTVTYAYDTKALTVYMTITADTDPDNPVTFSLSYGSQKWKFALSAPYTPWGTRPASDRSIYYDDIKIEYQKGDWDDDIVIKKPVVYYTGNTVIGPGDIAMISGENLGKTVKEIEVAQLPDNTARMGYILQNKYDKLAVDSEYSQSVSPETIYNSLTKKEKVELVFRSSTAVEFIIPKTFEKGMYAVKITPKYSTEKPEYVYINLPDVDYALGDEGEIATRGGYLRVVGKNIAIFADNKNGYTSQQEIAALNVKAQLKSAANATPINCEITSVESPYSFTVKVPEGIELGEYELSIYNGSGGDSAWSNPIKVSVGESPLANRPTDIFNVLDYGANPDEVGNDTPAIIAAIAAAAENGGGTVYIPSGVYGIRYAIPIPENVHLMGSGYETTSLVFNSLYYDFYELPKGMFVLEGNTEVSGFTYNAVRSPSVFYTNKKVENVYIHDVRAIHHPNQGTSTQGGGGRLLVTTSEAKLLIDDEASKLHTRAYSFTDTASSNIQIKDSIFKVSSPFYLVGSYNIVSNCKLYGGTASAEASQNKMLSDCSIFENNSRGDSATLAGAFEGNGLYLIGNEIGGTKTNNREIITTDGKMNYGNDLTGIIQKVEGDPSGLTYRFVTGHSFNVLNRWKGSQIYVMQGQGAMQYRTITYSMDDIIKIDTPFVIEPNRNSRVAIEDARADLIYYNNTASDGGMVGTYGTQCGAVYDSNTYYQCEANRMRAHAGAPVWYQSFNRNTYYDGNFWHVNADGDISSSVGTYGGINISPTNYKNIISSMMVRNCDFSKNMMIHIAATVADNIQNIVFDNNSFKDCNNAYRITANLKNSLSVIMYRNTFDNVVSPILLKGDGGVPYSSDLSRICESKNEYGFAYLTIIGNYYADNSKPKLGDVNLNGSVTIKDVTLIRYYLIGKVDFTSDMFVQADVNEDGSIDILDATILKMFIAGKVAKLGKDWRSDGGNTGTDPGDEPSVDPGDEPSDDPVVSPGDPVVLPEDEID